MLKITDQRKGLYLTLAVFLGLVHCTDPQAAALLHQWGREKMRVRRHGGAVLADNTTV